MKTIQSGESLKPLLKWPGGKRWILSHLKDFIPEHFDRYVEPFAGGAAVFFALRPTAALLSDVNCDLINMYSVVASQPQLVIEKLKLLNNSEADYYRMRNSHPSNEIEHAVRLLYLMKLSFNGIYRVNLKGSYNVPYGQKINAQICDEEHILKCSAALKSAHLKVADFRETFHSVTAGDLVYIDPPYTVAHNNNGFLKYNESIFSWKDQQDLAECARAATKVGATIIISNADHADVRNLYNDFECTQIKRYTSVSGVGDGRKHVSEIIITRSA